MRKNLSFIFLCMAIIFSANAQSGIIKVNVQDGCGNTFDKPVKIELYRVSGSSLTKLRTLETNPAKFSNLNTNSTYEVKISSSDVSNTDISIKDAFAMRYIILGQFNNLGHLPSIFASDANGNSIISTLDLVLFMRYLIKFPHQSLSYKEWFFVDQNNLESKDYLLKNRTEINGIPNGQQEITFNAYQHGAVISTIDSFCNTCIEDSTSLKTLSIPDLDVVAGTEVTFDLEQAISALDIGYSISLKFKNGVVKSINPYQGAFVNLIDSLSTINIANVYEFQTLPTSNIIQIKFVPSKDGKLSSFFTFNENYKNEFVYQEDGCVKTYQNLTINNIPSCPITWPTDKVIPDCTSLQNTGVPKISSSCANYINITFSDQVFGNPCNKILRTWTAINWHTTEIFTHIQVLTVFQVQPLNCVGLATILVKDSVKIWAIDFVKNIENNHIYSFSETDSSKQSMYFYNWQTNIKDIQIYDLTDKKSCVVQLSIINSGCKDPVNIIPEISVVRTDDMYIVNGSMFNGGNQNHCLGNIGTFQLKLNQTSDYTDQLSFDYNEYKGTQLKVALKYKINGIDADYGLVNINFVSSPTIAPFEIVCYDDPVEKNELFEVAFFSSTFENIYGLQAAIRLKDAIMVSTKKKALSDISFNEELRSLRFVWLLPTVTPLTLSGTDTLFTVTIRPTVTGNLSDILTIADDLLKSEAILNDFEQTKVDLVFRFLKRTSSTQDIRSDDIKIHPNPSSTGTFTIKSNGDAKGKVSIYNESGQEVYISHQEVEDESYRISMPEGIKNGIYMVRLTNEKSVTTKKIILLR